MKNRQNIHVIENLENREGGQKMQETYNIYDDIAERTNGDIYIGVVGPVRTGKSTFIKKFMDLLVIPNMENEFAAERARDELPQSASGKTIMTTEPKFIPNEAVNISLSENANLKIRMIDCVGYIVDGALGHIENDMPRMVNTPWQEDPMPFNQAAEIGTRKVIAEHSTIGLVVTTDGSITDIDRDSYLDAEKRVISELKELNKPFVVLLNSAHPTLASTVELKKNLEKEYGVPILVVNCQELTKNDISFIMESVLFEFPINEFSIEIPKWIDALETDHWLLEELYGGLHESMGSIKKIREAVNWCKEKPKTKSVKEIFPLGMDLGKGCVNAKLEMIEDLFYTILKEKTGLMIDGDDSLITTLEELSAIKREYDKVAFALHEVRANGYGIVSPTIDELSLEEPQIVKQGGRFGVKLKASAPSIHMIRADIQTEVSPIVGTEKQSEELVHYLLKEFETDPKLIWQSNIFGKSLHELVNEGLHNKLSRMPQDAQIRLQETLQRIINEGSGGLICIIL